MMLDKVKTRVLISLGSLAVTSFVLMMGYTAGQHSTARQNQQEIAQSVQKLVREKEAKNNETVLSADTV